MPDTVGEQSQNLILSCIDRGLGILGTTGKAAAIYMLETKHGIAPTELVEIGRLTYALRAIFGVGSAVLLRAIKDQLRSVNSSIDEVKASIDKAARQVEDVLHRVEHGLA